MSITMMAPRQSCHTQSRSRMSPLHEPAAFVDGPNQYQYVGGDPVGAVDPMGLVPTHRSNSISDDLVLGLRELQVRKDYDWNVNGGKVGPDGAWLWEEAKKVKWELRMTLTIFAYVERPIRATDCKEEMANQLGTHAFIATTPPPWNPGQVIGYGITDTKAKKGARAAQIEIYESGDTYRIYPLYRRPGAFHATDREVAERIASHPMDRDYMPVLYDCRGWARAALLDAGLGTSLNLEAMSGPDSFGPGMSLAEWTAKAH